MYIGRADLCNAKRFAKFRLVCRTGRYELFLIVSSFITAKLYGTLLSLAVMCKSMYLL